ncbi:MAG: helix-turn-helix transcriptional regulator [Acetatifactor sp.]|nr:helix-turn-helix transcriptional regulator [Acetatifactor sp.]
MDQKRIGAFISQCRKEKNLTQMQIAELLGITNQAVSKWENGRGMPDVSLLQPLCDALGISLNELFSGEHISAEEYKGKAEENISKLFKEKQIANHKPVKYLFSICANAALLVAVIELAVGLVGNVFNPAILKPILINVSVWLILFLASMSKLAYDRKKLKDLKHSGVCIDSEIEDMIPAAWIRVGNYTSCRIVCRFIYDGKEYKAVSNYYVLTPFKRKEDLYANVYIDKDDPARYSVELFQAGR